MNCRTCRHVLLSPENHGPNALCLHPHNWGRWLWHLDTMPEWCVLRPVRKDVWEGGKDMNPQMEEPHE